MLQCLKRKIIFLPLILLLYFPISFNAHDTEKKGSVILAEELLLFPSNSSPLKNQIFQCQFYLEGKFAILTTRVKPGYGILKNTEASFIEFFAVYKNGKRKKIGKKPFRGVKSIVNPLYLKTVSPVKINNARLYKAKQILADIFISYCDLKKSICYQEKKSLSVDL